MGCLQILTNFGKNGGELEQEGKKTERKGEKQRALARAGRSTIYSDLFSPGWLYKPGLKVHLSSRFVTRTGTKCARGGPSLTQACHHVFSTGSWHEPVLKVRHEPVLMSAARLAVGTGTNGHISVGSIANRDK